MTDENKSTISTEEQEISSVVEQLKSGLLYYFDIPEELRNDCLIVAVERECGIRRSAKKGYDIIRNNFFVEELVLCRNGLNEIIEREIVTTFDNFSSYYEFLQGDIYENACYYKYDFTQDEITKYLIDVARMNFKSLITYTIDDFTINYTKDELKQYNEKEKIKKEIKQWISKFNCCTLYGEFEKLINNLSNSKFSNMLEFFLFNYINNNKETAFDIIIKFLNNYRSLEIEKGLCLIYDPQRVYEAYNNKYYSPLTAKKYKRELKHFIDGLESGEFGISSRSYFDTETHYFVRYYRIKNISTNYTEVLYYLYFETFDELSEYLGYDLSYRFAFIAQDT